MTFSNFDTRKLSVGNTGNITRTAWNSSHQANLNADGLDAEKLLADHLFANQKWLATGGPRADDDSKNSDGLDRSEMSFFLKNIDEKYGDGDGEITLIEIQEWKDANDKYPDGGHNAVLGNTHGLKDLNAQDVFEAIKSFFGLVGTNSITTKETTSLYNEFEETSNNTELIGNAASFNFLPADYGNKAVEEQTQIYGDQILNLANGEIDKYDADNDGMLNLDEYTAMRTRNTGAIAEKEQNAKNAALEELIYKAEEDMNNLINLENADASSFDFAPDLSTFKDSYRNTYMRAFNISVADLNNEDFSSFETTKAAFRNKLNELEAKITDEAKAAALAQAKEDALTAVRTKATAEFNFLNTYKNDGERLDRLELAAGFTLMDGNARESRDGIITPTSLPGQVNSPFGPGSSNADLKNIENYYFKTNQ